MIVIAFGSTDNSYFDYDNFEYHKRFIHELFLLFIENNSRVLIGQEL